MERHPASMRRKGVRKDASWEARVFTASLLAASTLFVGVATAGSSPDPIGARRGEPVGERIGERIDDTRSSPSGSTPPSQAPAGPASVPAGDGPTAPPPSPGQEDDAARKIDPQVEPPKSLDELLGVPKSPGSGERSADDAAEREQQRRLERSLDEASMQDLVARAIEGMKNASSRLGDARDAGLGTQRTQEEVVRTLDRLLEEAQRQQQKGRSSSKSSKSSGKPQQSQDPSEQNGQQQQASSRQRPQQSQAGSQAGDGTPPADAQREEIDGAPGELSESRIEWGRLPERIRELVLQGRRDRVSTIYERLTREYYQRLAEEASR